MDTMSTKFNIGWECLRIVRYLGAVAGSDRVWEADRSGIRYRLSVACEECELLSRSQIRECMPAYLIHLAESAV
jgi:hypothetical protein